MLQWDKSLCEQLDDIYESKQVKEKKIEQLKDEIHKDTIKYVAVLMFFLG